MYLSHAHTLTNEYSSEIYLYEKICNFLMFTAVTYNKIGFFDIYIYIYIYIYTYVMYVCMCWCVYVWVFIYCFCILCTHRKRKKSFKKGVKLPPFLCLEL